MGKTAGKQSVEYLELPKDDMNFIIETLIMDSDSGAFDKDIRSRLGKIVLKFRVHQADEILNLKEAIVPNWFFKENIEELTGKKISKQRFDDFKKWIDGSPSFADSISADIADEFETFARYSRNKKFMQKSAGEAEND